MRTTSQGLPKLTSRKKMGEDLRKCHNAWHLFEGSSFFLVDIMLYVTYNVY